MRFLPLLAFAALVLLLSGCGTELKQRKKALQALVSTNASLSVVEATIGHIPIYERGSKEWNATRQLYERYSYANYQAMVARINKSAAFGMTSTPTMITYIFLDDHRRLIDFAVDVQ
jgi:hypothetical protein